MNVFLTILGAACGLAALIVALGRFVERIREQERERAQAARADEFVRLEGAVSVAEAKLKHEELQNALAVSKLRGMLDESRMARIEAGAAEQNPTDHIFYLQHDLQEIRKECDRERTARHELIDKLDQARRDLELTTTTCATAQEDLSIANESARMANGASMIFKKERDEARAACKVIREQLEAAEQQPRDHQIVNLQKDLSHLGEMHRELESLLIQARRERDQTAKAAETTITDLRRQLQQVPSAILHPPGVSVKWGPEIKDPDGSGYQEHPDGRITMNGTVIGTIIRPNGDLSRTSAQVSVGSENVGNGQIRHIRHIDPPPVPPLLRILQVLNQHDTGCPIDTISDYGGFEGSIINYMDLLVETRLVTFTDYSQRYSITPAGRARLAGWRP